MRRGWTSEVAGLAGGASQLATAVLVVGLAVGVIAWMAAASPRTDGVEDQIPPAKVHELTPLTSPLFATPNAPGVLVLVVRDEEQAEEARAMLASEGRVRAMAEEPTRETWVVVAPEDDIYRALADDANLAGSGGSQVHVSLIDLR